MVIRKRRVAALTFMMLTIAAPALAATIEGYPDVVICRSGDKRTVTYLHRVNDDGSATYMTLGDQFATVTPDGIFRRDGAADCDGKSLEQLEQDDQTRDLGGSGG